MNTRVKIIKDYFSLKSTYFQARENGHTEYNAEGKIVHVPTKDDPYYHVRMDIHPGFKEKRTLLVTYLHEDDFANQ